MNSLQAASRFAIPLILLGAVICSVTASVKEASASDETTGKKIDENFDAQQVDTWIAQLNDKKLSARMKAREELVKAGSAAIPQLVVAAGSDDADIREKSVSLLGVLLASKDDDTKEAALVALQLLADSDLPAVSVLAKRALASSGIPGVAPKPQMQNSFSRRSVSVVNGARTITAEDDNRRVQIRDQNGRNIEVEITEGDKTSKVKANSAQELKQADARAHEIYEELTSGGQQNQLKLNGFGFGGNGGGGANLSFSGSFSFGNQGNVPIQAVPPANGAVVDQFQIMINHLEQLKKQFPENDQLSQLIDQQIQQLKKQGG